MIKKIIHKFFGKKILTSFLLKMENSFIQPMKYYLYCNTYLEKHISLEIKLHRKYFQEENRAFGEDAFTIMWYFLYEKFEFKNFLEIGVYRGQTITLLALLAKMKDRKINVYGLSPLKDANDSVTFYAKLNYKEDIEKHTKYFDLNSITLIEAYSNDLTSINFVNSKSWDCIYIDGSHDYEIVKNDFELSFQNLKKGGVIVMDDSSLFINNFYGQFKGHPGPSKIADEFVSKKMKEFLRVGHNRCFIKL